MKLEVLLSCMTDDPLSIVKKNRITSKVLVVNQNGFDGLHTYQNNKIRVLETSTSGLTKSRNIALSMAEGDILLLCDDDVIYYENYEHAILTEFENNPSADIMVFNIERINYKGKGSRITRRGRAPFYRSYGSVRIAFRRKSVQGKLEFNELFGSGSVYSSGEETIFLNEARKQGLKIYESPQVIAQVDFSESSWFKGFDHKFFFDRGALLREAYPKTYPLLQFYYVQKKFRDEMSMLEIIRAIEEGKKDYIKRINLSGNKDI